MHISMKITIQFKILLKKNKKTKTGKNREIVCVLRFFAGEDRVLASDGGELFSVKYP